jgi:hypothetical protein
MAQIFFDNREDALNYIKGVKRDIAKSDNAYYDVERDNVLFRLKTRFRWGRHKGNQLSDVYKVEPSYIEWCIRTCSGFAIYEPDLILLQEATVFDMRQLNSLCQRDSTESNTYYLDFRSYPRDKNGFLVSDKILEHPHYLDQTYINKNKEKSNGHLNYTNYQDGIPDDNAEQTHFPLISTGIRIKIQATP